MPLPHKLLLIALTIPLATSACIKKASSQAESADAKDARKDESALVAPAMAVIKKIDYLPFWNWLAGCGERADSMGLELDVAGLPWHTVTVTPKAGNTIWPVANIPQRVTPIPVGTRSSWRFHVALVYHTGATDTVIDPSMAAEPISLDAWLAAIGTDRSKVVLQFSDAHVDDRSDEPGSEENVLTTAAKMHELSDYSGETPGDTAELSREVAKLDQRFTELAQALIKAGKLTPAEDPTNAVTPANIAETALANAD